MEKELTVLEQKLELLIQQVGVLRAENAGLRERVTVLEGDKRRLVSKVELTAARVESVLAMLPAVASEQ